MLSQESLEPVSVLGAESKEALSPGRALLEKPGWEGKGRG